MYAHKISQWMRSTYIKNDINYKPRLDLNINKDKDNQSS